MKIKSLLILSFYILTKSIHSEKNNKFQISPNQFKKNDFIEIRIPQKPPMETAIIRPDGEVVYTDIFFKKVGYPSIKNLKLKVNDIYGFVYINGNETRTKVFKMKGKYKFYFADNLETETNNTYSISFFVHFLGK
ncbi:hypothetical protein EHQ43_17605 [Leptospira bouyouniensis]|uniref:Uncharacterized protein n=1 Tax=Leptospira bouyouniensis TaxID=2484911 RepID=A0A7I0HMI6_9LEPT|nr:hypothetical protein [Leptospira bouyouniensis]TGL02175.1 hypothetical protein EHQ43_17605 [Leptospira bouyouniensis]